MGNTKKASSSAALIHKHARLARCPKSPRPPNHRPTPPKSGAKATVGPKGHPPCASIIGNTAKPCIPKAPKRSSGGPALTLPTLNCVGA